MRTTVAELEALHRTRYGAFVRVAAAIAGDPTRGADAVHDAFGSAIERLGPYRSDAPLEAWVWRIVIRAAGAGRASTLQVPECYLQGPENVAADGEPRDPRARRRAAGAAAARDLPPLLRRPRPPRDRQRARCRGGHRLGDPERGAPLAAPEPRRGALVAPWQAGPSSTARALAAIGGDRYLVAVVEPERSPDSIVDLATGTERPLPRRFVLVVDSGSASAAPSLSSWSSIGGVVTSVGSGGEPDADPGISSFAGGYRKALADGSAKVVGTTTYRGPRAKILRFTFDTATVVRPSSPVVSRTSQPGGSSEDVAVDVSTYRPLCAVERDGGRRRASAPGAGAALPRRLDPFRSLAAGDAARSGVRGRSSGALARAGDAGDRVARARRARRVAGRLRAALDPAQGGSA
jgi:hypothetical protein